MRSKSLAALLAISFSAAAAPGLQPLKYNNPGLVVDLGVGLWALPLPCDYDGDGDMDMVVACPDTPYNGTYLFENTSGKQTYPVFEPAVRIGEGIRNLTVCHLEDGWRFLTPGAHYPDFRTSGFSKPAEMPFKPEFHIGRANQWKLVDYDGDGALDLIVGASDWREYGWDDAYNERGEWTRGPLHGYVYLMKNTGTNDAPAYAAAVQVEAGGRPVDVYGCPSPNFVDADGDEDLDLICGEFLDRITYFENTGTRTAPSYAAGKFLTHNGEDIRMDLEMMQVVALDWDGDGDVDLVVGQEDGRVALMEHTGRVDEGMPQFLPPRFFQQKADLVKCGALSTPYVIDWDGDGWDDIVAGDTAGYINFVKNLDGGCPPKWAAPVYLEADGEVIRIQAGPNGSIQGPCEAKWGYTVLNVADWDGDGLADILINSIWGKILWYRNVGERTAPKLAAAQAVEVEWEGVAPKPEWNWWSPEGKGLVTQWRTSPVVIDLNGDGLNDLVMLDQEGYLAFFERQKRSGGVVLLPPARIFRNEKGEPLRLNEGRAGKSGRKKIAITDWDGDGRVDLIVNSENADFWRNVGGAGEWVFKNEGKLDPRKLAGHSTCPAMADWDRDGIPDLVLGAEDGFFYYKQNARTGRAAALPAEKAAAYQAAVQSCLDNLIEHGSDRYGAVQTPMWMSVIDIHTNEAPREPEIYDSDIRTEERQHRRNPGGCDLWDHQPALRAAYALTAFTGDNQYGDAADAFARSFMERAGLPHGLLSWGSHIFYDAYGDEPAGDSIDGRVGPHEILVMLPLWERLWALNPEVVRREIDAFWEWHVADKATGLHNRHDDKRPGCDFAFSGGELACAQAFLYSKTGEAEYLRRARLVAEYHWNARNKDTNLAPDAPNLSDRYDGHHCFTTLPGPHAALLLRCFQYTNDAWFKETALAHIGAYLKYGWDEAAGRWWGMLTLDGQPVPQEEKGAAYDAFKPTGYIDMWPTIMFSYEFPIVAGQTALYANGIANEAAALQSARNWARSIRAELPPKQGRRWAAEMREAFPDLDEAGDSNAENYGRAISFFLGLHYATKDPADLETAVAIADEAMKRLYENGWFKGHPRKPLYETADGVGYLLYGLLELAAYPQPLRPNL